MNVAAHEDTTGYTHFANKLFSFTWNISNCFSGPNSPPFQITSPEFTDKWGSTWVLELYPTKNEITFGLHWTSRADLQVTAKISFLDSSNSVKDTLTVEGLTNSDPKSGAQKIISVIPFKFLEDLDSILKDDTVRICCDIWIQYLERRGTSMLPEYPIDFQSHSNSLRSDVTVVVNSVKYPVHKVILAAGSPVFSALIKGDMVKTKTNCVVISDFPAEVVQGMLKFIYTNDMCFIPTESRIDYLRIAHTYDIRGLMWNAERWLIKSLSVENTVEMWRTGTMYGASGLLKEVAVQTNKKYNEVTQSAGFANLSGKELNEFCQFAIQAANMIVGNSSGKFPLTSFKS